MAVDNDYQHIFFIYVYYYTFLPLLPLLLILIINMYTYLSCIVSADISSADSVMPMLYLYIHSKSSNDSIKEIYRSVYDHMIEIIIQQDNPVKAIS